MSEPPRPARRRRTWFHRAFVAAGLLGLTLAVLLGAAGFTRRAQREAQRQSQLAQAKRLSVTSTRSRLRPLDPRVDDAKLAREMPRRVLGLYNSRDVLGRAEEGVTHEEFNHVHLKAELILNHLGLLVDLRDVNAPPLDDEQMRRYRGIVSWFSSGRVARPAVFLRWLTRQAQQGRKVVVLGQLTSLHDDRGQPVAPLELQQFFASIGLSYGGLATDDADKIAVVSRRSPLVEFERRLPLQLPYYEQLGLSGDGETWLGLRRIDRDNSDSAAVAVTSRGGYVAPGYAIHESRLGKNYVMQWRVDPFAFFARALDVSATPRPDFTTLNGSRIFYTHIDGDGLPSITEIDRRSMCGEYARDHILKAYDLPVTVSFVVAGIEPPPGGMGNARRLQVARSIAALPNVESASHGYAHPMNWRAYTKAQTSYEPPGYKMNAEKEIAYSTRYINEQINPPGKPTMVMLWTGWCNPAEDQLAIAAREGLYNLNGGDPVMDGEFPSYLHLVPPVNRVGNQLQFFTSGPNDFVLTKEWQPPYHRWANLIEMFRRTDAPRRVYPMNVYYHFYLAQQRAAMQAMHQVLRWVVARQPAPLYVSQYIDVVRDFANMRLAALGSDGKRWRVLNSGYCRTLRFDGPPRHVALERSSGVVGYDYLPRQRALYVHLDESHDHTIQLAQQRPTRPFVVRASSYLSRVRLSVERAQLIMAGIGRKHLTLANMTPRARYRVVAVNEQGRRLVEVVNSKDSGSLEWSGDINGSRIALSVERSP